MADASLAGLRGLLISRYSDLRRKLIRKFGSVELADDVMQETWLRLSRLEFVPKIQNPNSYLHRVVFNAAIDGRRSEKKHLSSIEIDSLLELADDAPDPIRIVEDRSQIQELKVILAELPARRRDILLAARLDNMPRQEIADRFGISLRLVTEELRLAQAYCLARREQNND